MSLSAGTRLGSYEVLGAIGAGGMGEVYRARDTKLDRDVAIKIMPEPFLHDAQRVARFQREAKLLASLNHPNIGGIYGLEEAQGLTALVLELIDGRTLADLIVKGPIPLDEALPIARQIAEALETAHEHGIIHRDLKPANIKVREDGTVKVLDFGLAKALDPATENSDAAVQRDISHSPTMTSPSRTMRGVILGTAAYMSPEQAKGKPVDRRTDMWAFGCVLFEMLTGKRAVAGGDVSEILAEIIKGEPDWSSLPNDTPPALARLLRRCFAKDRKARLSDAAVARLEIEEAIVSPVEIVTPPRRPSTIGSHRIWIYAAVGSLTIAATVALAVWNFKPERPSPLRRFAVTLSGNEQFSSIGGRRAVALSPDGSLLVYAANQQLHLRQLASLDATAIEGTTDGAGPFFSPDGQSIGFWQDGRLKKVGVAGGPPIVLCESPNPRGAYWADTGFILFSRGPEGIWQVPATGGQPTRVIELKEGEIAESPQLLPDGRTVLFTLMSQTAAQAGQSFLDSAQIVVQSPGGDRNVIVHSGSDAQYLRPGVLVYVRQGTLVAAPFDVRRLVPSAEPVVLGHRVWQSLTSGSISSGTMGVGGAAQYTLSESGLLVYAERPSGLNERTLAWVNRQGAESPIAVAPPRAYIYPRISPDGTRLALDIRDQQQDIHIWDVSRETLTRLTHDAAADISPLWAPDGKRIVYAAVGQGIFSRSADGTESVEQLTTERVGTHIPTAVSPDGTLLLFNHVENSRWGTRILKLTPKGEPRPLVDTSFNELNATFAPDGRWVAYESNESGQEEIYIRPFPDIQGGRWLLSTGGGSRPLWSSSGEIFYLAFDPLPTMMAVQVQTKEGFKAQTPRKLFSGPYYTGQAGRTYDVSPDGQRFLMIKNRDQTGASGPRIVVIENWLSELKKR